jgi:hypothetical protein
VLEGGAQVAQERIELVLGIPRHDGPHQGPDRGRKGPGRENGRKRQPVCLFDQGARLGMEWVLCVMDL